MFLLVILIGILASAFTVSAVVRTVLRTLERGQQARPYADPRIEQRLERIERAVDAMAVEVERIAEGQRFTTRLLSESARSSLPPAGATPRSITPH